MEREPLFMNDSPDIPTGGLGQEAGKPGEGPRAPKESPYEPEHGSEIGAFGGGEHRFSTRAERIASLRKAPERVEPREGRTEARPPRAASPRVEHRPEPRPGLSEEEVSRRISEGVNRRLEDDRRIREAEDRVRREEVDRRGAADETRRRADEDRRRNDDTRREAARLAELDRIRDESRAEMDRLREELRRAGRGGTNPDALAEARRRREEELRREDKRLLPVRTRLGSYIDREWPISKEGQLRELRTLLNAIEETKQPNGGDRNAEPLEEVFYVLNALRSGAGGPEDQGIEQILYKEFMARITLHNTFLAYETADSARAVKEVVNNIQGDHLNYFLLESKEENLDVWGAFQYYGSHATEFLALRDDADIRAFRAGVQASIRAVNPGIDEVSAVSAQTVAERLFDITSRRVAQDVLVSKTTRQAPTAAELAEGNVEWLGDASGGNFAARRVERFRDNLYASIGAARVYPELARGVYLQSYDWVTATLGAVEGHYEKVLFTRYAEMGGRTSAQIKRDSKIGARQIAEALLGQRKLDTAETDENGLHKSYWVRRDAQGNALATLGPDGNLISDAGKYEGMIDCSNVSWTGRDAHGNVLPALRPFVGIFGEVPTIDVKAINGDHAMFGWGLRRVDLADGARDALMGKPESYLRNPDFESLATLADAFSYQLDDQYKTKLNLMINLPVFLMNNEAVRKECGYPEMNRQGIRALLGNVALKLKLNREELLKANKEVLGEGLRSDLLLAKDALKPGETLAAMLLELIKQIGTRGMQISQ